MATNTDHILSIKITHSTTTGNIVGNGKFAMDTRVKLVLCAGGVFFCYFYYGILQETITRGVYRQGDTDEPEKFTYATCQVFIQCIINALSAKLALVVFGAPEDTTSNKVYALCATSYIGAMVASNNALRHVNYPTQVLGKSCKPIPVLILGVLLAKKRYPMMKYVNVVLIVCGVALFVYKDDKAASGNVEGGLIGMGELLLLVSLALDGVTGAVQDRMRATSKPSPYQLMLNMNLWSLGLLVVGILLTGEVFAFLGFVQRYPYVMGNCLLFGVTSAMGQMFIFTTVTSFGPLTCSIITTTRKFFTILASVIFFGNSLSQRQSVAVALVFLGLGLDALYGKEIKEHPGPTARGSANTTSLRADDHGTTLPHKNT